MRKLMILIGFLLVLPFSVEAADSSDMKTTTDTGYSSWYPEGTYSHDCEVECEPHVTMKTMIEGKVTNVNCLQSCQQRKVWEKLADAVTEVALALKNNSNKDILIPMEIKIDDLKNKVNSIENKLDALVPPEKKGEKK